MDILEILIDNKYYPYILYPNIKSLSQIDCSDLNLSEYDYNKLSDISNSKKELQRLIIFKTSEQFGIVGMGINGFECVYFIKGKTHIPIKDTMKVLPISGITSFHIENIRPAKGGGYIPISIQYNDTSESLLMLFFATNHDWDNKLEKFKKEYLLKFIYFLGVKNEITQYDSYNC